MEGQGRGAQFLDRSTPPWRISFLHSGCIVLVEGLQVVWVVFLSKSVSRGKQGDLPGAKFALVMVFREAVSGMFAIQEGQKKLTGVTVGIFMMSVVFCCGVVQDLVENLRA